MRDKPRSVRQWPCRGANENKPPAFVPRSVFRVPRSVLRVPRSVFRVPRSPRAAIVRCRNFMKAVYLVVIALVLLNLVVFGQLASHSFVNYDDGEYVYENAHVKEPSLSWAMTSTQSGWFPLTWISHMVDVKLWGMNAGGHLLTSLALHIIST